MRADAQQSVEAEQAILGALLLEPAAWPRVAGVVRADDFYRPDHRLIVRAIADLSSKGRPHDAIAVIDTLQRRGELSDAGGAAYLSQIARNTASSSSVRHYAELVRERATLRELARVADKVSRSVADSRGRDAAEILAEAAQAIIALQASARVGKGLIRVEQLAGELVDDLDRRREKCSGLSVGLADFDDLTCGLEPGDLVVIAARPGMGKTALMVTIADHVSTANQPVAVFSAEMPAAQLMRRHVARNSAVSQSLLRRAEKLTDIDWASITPALTAIARCKLWIDDSGLPHLSHVRAESFALKIQHGLALVLVDYVQLVQGDGANRYEQLRDVSYGLKALAKELAIPVIVLAQLNRGVESRDRKRPHLSDLRDSGAIEEAADIVGLLYSEAYYSPEFSMPYVLECNVVKNRNGERGQCLWHFAGQHSRVSVLEPGPRAQYRHLLSRAAGRGAASDDL